MARAGRLISEGWLVMRDEFWMVWLSNFLWLLLCLPVLTGFFRPVRLHPQPCARRVAWVAILFCRDEEILWCLPALDRCKFAGPFYPGVLYLVLLVPVR